MGLPKLWGKDSSGNHGFAFSHVKTIYYNWSSKKLLSTKLSEMDTATNNRILKSDISNVQVNNQNKVPSSALVYGMNNQISELNASVSDLTQYFGTGTEFNIDFTSRKQGAYLIVTNYSLRCVMRYSGSVTCRTLVENGHESVTVDGFMLHLSSDTSIPLGMAFFT